MGHGFIFGWCKSGYLYDKRVTENQIQMAIVDVFNINLIVLHQYWMQVFLVQNPEETKNDILPGDSKLVYVSSFVCLSKIIFGQSKLSNK